MRVLALLVTVAAACVSSDALAQDAVTSSSSAPAPALIVSRPGSDSNSDSTAVPTAGIPPATIAPAAPTLAPIASAAPGSSTFQYVPNAVCSEDVVSKISQIYNKNRAMFDECVSDADYQIFPHSGQSPTAQQIRAMATSPSCVAIFTAVVLAGFPACDIGGMPMKAVTETLLKIKVDIDEGKESASAARFQELMYWRRDVNLAQAAGLPYDSDSALYQEYKVNLWKALASSTVRVSTDFTLEYQLSNGTYTHGALSFSNLPGGSTSSNSSDVVGSVRPASSSDGMQSSSQSEDVVEVKVTSGAPASVLRKPTSLGTAMVTFVIVSVLAATALA